METPMRIGKWYIIEYQSKLHAYIRYYTVYCPSCGAEGPSGDDYNEAIEKAYSEWWDTVCPKCQKKEKLAR